MSTTTALILNEVGKPFALSKVRLDSLRDDEALVEIQASGICHTDLSCANGTLPASFPAVLGHEGAGTIKEVGSGVHDLHPGDKVLLSFAHCSLCEQCEAGYPSYCSSFVSLNFGGKRMDGTSAIQTNDESKDVHSSFFGQSSFMKNAIVHRSCIVKVSKDTDLDLFAPIGCGFLTGAGVVLNCLDVQPGKTIAIFGVGSVGMSAVMAANIRKAKVIIAVDLHPNRLDLARKFGATHTLNGSDPDLVQNIKEICSSSGVQYAVDCTAAPRVIESMVDSLGIRGRAATVGAPAPGVRAGVEVFSHITGGRQYVGCCEGDAIPSQIIPYLIEQHAQGNYPMDQLVSFYDIRDHAKAVEDVISGKGFAIVGQAHNLFTSRTKNKPIFSETIFTDWQQHTCKHGFVGA